MPPYNTGLLDGELAWRQHDGGHTDAPNWKHFIPWATAQLARTPSIAPPRADLIGPADRPAARSDRNSRLAHEQLLAKAKQGGIDVYFVGDSITRRWGATDYPEFLAHWKRKLPRLERRRISGGARTARRTSSGGSRTASSTA